MPKLRVGGLRAGDRLEHQVDRRARADQVERRRHVREHAALRRDLELDADLVEHRQQRVRALGTVGRRVDADHRVAAPSSRPSRMLAAMPRGIVGRMVGLQPHRQPAGQADRVAEARDDRHFAAISIEILQPADLADRGHHLGRDAGRERRERRRRRLVRQQPVAKPADGQMRDRREGRRDHGCRRSAA